MMTLSDIFRFAGRLAAAHVRYGRVLLSERLFGDAGTRSRRSPVGRHSLYFAGKAVQLCRGTGVEIGSLHKRLPLVASVLYLDVRKTTELREIYRNDERVSHIGQVHLVAPGSRYPFIDDNAFDFVVSSHVLEHTCNPPRQIEEWLRIVRPGGIVYMIVPDKRFCFDRRREVTPLEHFVDEFESDAASITMDHYRDYIVNTNGEDGLVRDTSDAHIESCWRQQGSIHAHTFTADSFRQFLDFFAGRLSYQLVHFDADRLDMHAALRKL
ncbi:methyltransferase domain-containing protein [Sulfurisoma sediminicola]|uniref:Methyltransferase family protein n=1 Tax=Sulfurisoma sediminicola TaxID=1381557 RepID=A0A497XAS8_9PROT|nr:methyltransferase domain-containing protein [Sulfurisoma sediminicola]RLJ63665.1 methyltransferase family protein [Sulfurisoma sediminicola]